jgi:AraC-like DNA-binding protein
MDKSNEFIEIPVKSQTHPAFILEGTLKEYSTEDLHYHSCHQLLRISTGITLLVEENKQQPLFSNMTAFIPAGLPHRSVVMGKAILYKSIYLDETLFNPNLNDIRIFDLSELGIALFNRIDTRTIQINDTDSLNNQCLSLLLKLMETEINAISHITRIPVPGNPENIKITAYIEQHFDKKLKLSNFTDVLHYSERHISRLFKEDLNVSIFEYLKLYRIFQSALMLCEKETPKTITEIAFSCGYDSLSSFYKDFKDIFSMTPKMFKHDHKK